MAAAYAGLVSLMNLIEQLNHHPDPPISLDQEQVHALTKKVGFLQGFLEDFHSRGISQEIQGLESRIARVAHATEDVIESHIALASGSTTQEAVIENRSSTYLCGLRSVIQKMGLIKKEMTGQSTKREQSTDLCEGLRRVIQDMGFIEKEAMDTIKKMPKFKDDRLRRCSVLPLPPLTGSSLTDKTNQIMVGFDDIMIQIMDRLTGNQSRRLIVPIVGMGGSGKTTLARAINEKKLIMDHFDLRSWVTISQECVLRQALIECLLCQRNPRSREELSRESEQRLGEQLYQNLCGRKYLIVMDDVWDIEAWDKLKFFFPDNNNGSRIMITTRSSKLASDMTGSHGVINVDLLDEDTSWDLLCKKVFAEKGCPLELEEIGRKIARNCRGLPLSIVTIGGLLAKSGTTTEYWEYVSENSSSLVNSEDDERCLKILSLSYNHLPVYLKPCFLYMGLFPEDRRIRASYLIRLWVAEGFLKSISMKSLEAVGEDYLKDLLERNLVLVRQEHLGSTGKIKYCVLHDLLRGLCLREAQKEKFFLVERIDNLQANGIIESQRRIVLCERASNKEDSPHHRIMLTASPFLRSCIVDSDKEVKFAISLRSAQKWRLRILAGVDTYGEYDFDDIVPLNNLRFISGSGVSFESTSILWSMSWNIQTIIVRELEFDYKSTATLDIWKMPQLRHAEFNYSNLIHLSDPPSSSSSVDAGRLLILENLQTLRGIWNFKCSEEVVKRIPNIKELGIYYYADERRTRTTYCCLIKELGICHDGRTWTTYYCLNNLGRLKSLQSLKIRLEEGCAMRLDGLTLPYSLKKLTLSGFELDDEMMSTTIGGSLPLLQVLKLTLCNFVGNEWNPVEGQFCHLKYLLLWECFGLKYWNANNTHFPCLEHLKIVVAGSLEEFPSGIGDIPMLRSIVLSSVKDSVIMSAWRMLVEQEEQLGIDADGLQIHVYTGGKSDLDLEGMARNNFKIIS